MSAQDDDLSYVPLRPKVTVNDDAFGSKKISHIQFGTFGRNDIGRLSEFEAVNRNAYEQATRTPEVAGVLDRRLGVSDKHSTCETCGARLQDCPGHYGHIELVLPVFHIGYFKPLLAVLQCICKACSRVLISFDERNRVLRQMAHPLVKHDHVRRAALVKRLVEKCKKVRDCPYCREQNGLVKKVGSMKIVHERYKEKDKTEKAENARNAFFSTFEAALKAPKGSFETAHGAQQGADLKPLLIKAQDDLNPLRVRALLMAIPECDLPLLDMSELYGRPENLLIDHLLVPPVPIRPSVVTDAASGSNEDDLTVKLNEIIEVNNIIRNALAGGKALVHNVVEDWEYLQFQCAMYLNGANVPNVRPEWQQNKRSIRAFAQRLKGKQGRFRGNLSGKRVDFSGRTVISPDPNLKIDEVCVPIHVAKVLTYPQRVFAHNLSSLRQLVLNGPDVWPGANYVEAADTGKKSLKYGDRRRVASELKVGDTVERHLSDGDVVLFNRQPSLHKLSIMAHRARVMSGRTFRFNECVCAPYNADFDGDEMNLHLPQTEEARAESLSLLGVLSNLVTPRNGEIVVSATQDFLTGAYLLSLKSVFLTRDQFARLVVYMGDANEAIELPPPAILKPIELWTGKQIFSLMLRPTSSSPLVVNLECPNKKYNVTRSRPEPLHMCPDDGYVCIYQSELISGVLDKSLLGGGSKSSLFATLLRDHSAEASALAMGRLAKLTARFLADHGFSIGINDVQPTSKLTTEKTHLLARGYEQCDAKIQEFESGKLTPQPGCTPQQTLESELNGMLSKIRDDAGEICKQELHRLNAPLTMATCGSKGSFINISQMIACVGQQTVGGKRTPNGFVHRALPHFPRHSLEPAAKGFVANSFYTGLSPTEFFFHTMGGREGLVDTAVKTAETGYIQRRLMKALEDLTVLYDGSVRNSEANLVQFRYGDDGLDPACMEGKDGKPLNFARVLLTSIRHGRSGAPEAHRPLTPHELREMCQEHCESAIFLSMVKRDEDVHGNTHGSSKYEKDLKAFVEGLAQTQAKQLGVTLEPPPAEAAVAAAAASKGKAKVGGTKGGKANDKAKGKQRGRIIVDSDEEDGGVKMEVDPGSGSAQPIKSEQQQQQQQQDDGSADPSITVTLQRRLQQLSRPQMAHFFAACLRKYGSMRIEPGSAVGAVGAQSIGEPGTQMTLKTFHFAGVASMNVTLGVPRIKEIINAARKVSTPIIKAELSDPYDAGAARTVKGRLERTYLGEICNSIREVLDVAECYVYIELDTKRIAELHLSVDSATVREAILALPKLKVRETDLVIESPSTLKVHAWRCTREDHALFELHRLRLALTSVIVCGIKDVSRAIITLKEDNEKTPEEKASGRPAHRLLVEGTGLQAVMGVSGVAGARTRSTHIMEVERTLGIEAARKTIVDEIEYTMSSHGMEIDSRHVALLADVMTFRGEVLGITRFGVPKMRQSVLMLASFEKTTDHLFEAAVHSRVDAVAGVSECIIMGIPIPLGTGIFKLLQRTPKVKLPAAKPLLFPSSSKHLNLGASRPGSGLSSRN